MGTGSSSRPVSRAAGSSSPSRCDNDVTVCYSMGTGSSSRPVSRAAGSSSPEQQLPKKKAHKSPVKTAAAKEQGMDVMISYSRTNQQEMLRLKEGLESRGISVWADVSGLKPGVDFISKIGQAIIDAKLFISLLSEKTLESKFCQDELALGYVSGKPIFPVGLQDYKYLYERMDTGMRLQLARFKWYMFLDPGEFEANLQRLVADMQKQLEAIRQKEAEQSGEKSSPQTDQPQQKTKRTRLYKQMSSLVEPVSQETGDFWEKHFQQQSEVDWEAFVSVLSEQYQDKISQMFSGDDVIWLKDTLRREMEVTDEGKVTRDCYDNFITVDGEKLHLWDRVHEQAIESYTMREVFNVDSSVRVQAIENLGKFHSNAVVEALLDLLQDKDNNVKAVAAISLARTGAKDKKVIQQLMKTLEHKDRLVRESGCLALGHLKVTSAVPKLVHLWRNDFISTVRDAAQVALELVGGDEAQQAMHMTKVLAQEIRELTKED